MLVELRKQLNQAVLTKNEALKSIIRVILGEASTLEARTNKPLTDEQVQGVVRKILLGNNETMGLMVKSNSENVNAPNYLNLAAENAFLESLLPQTLTVEQIKTQLADAIEQIKAAKSDGVATGLANKILKEAQLTVLGGDVFTAVKQLRG